MDTKPSYRAGVDCDGTNTLAAWGEPETALRCRLPADHERQHNDGGHYWRINNDPDDVSVAMAGSAPYQSVDNA